MAGPVEGTEALNGLVGTAVAGGHDEEVVGVLGAGRHDDFALGVEGSHGLLHEADLLRAEGSCEVERDLVEAAPSHRHPGEGGDETETFVFRDERDLGPLGA